MLTGTVALLALGLVIAAAAVSLPGGDDEPLVDLAVRDSPDLTAALAWIILLLAIVGLVLSVSSVRAHRPERKGGKRGLLAVVIALATFALVLSWVRPAARSWLEETPSAVDASGEVVVDAPGSEPGVWLFALLLAGVAAVLVTRVGLAIHAPAVTFPSDSVLEVPDSQPEPTPVVPDAHVGDDPRSRILQAYHEFEIGLDAAGHPRSEAETTGRHARAAARSLDLDRAMVDSLVGHHAMARYGPASPAPSDAAEAEAKAFRLLEQIRG
jgi:hypothetical protein